MADTYLPHKHPGCREEQQGPGVYHRSPMGKWGCMAHSVHRTHHTAWLRPTQSYKWNIPFLIFLTLFSFPNEVHEDKCAHKRMWKKSQDKRKLTADFRCSPLDVHIVDATFMHIGCYSCAQALTVPTCITATGIKLAPERVGH